jgi:cation diffusion facilitator CzcD-associated flavoprotein CzcO
MTCQEHHEYYSTGTYNRKKVPLIPNMVRFDGDMWHTVDWPSTYDFAGKKVAYVGTGPTSLQALPAIQPHLKSLTIYMRSMTYCHPFQNINYPPWVLWCFAWLPGLTAFYAFVVAYAFGFWTWFVFRPGTWLAKREESFCNAYLDKQVRDPVLREKLRPRGRFGSKRPLVSPLFFELVQKENVEVAAEEITEIDERGIKSVARNPKYDLASSETAIGLGASQGEPKIANMHREFDTIIWGTGFIMQGWGLTIPTRGIKGKLLSEHWDDRRGHSMVY